MKRIFVCSPYRGDTAANAALARETCRQVLAQGDAPLAPHLLYPEILDDQVAAERSQGMSAGLAWLAAADEVLVVGEPTEGMRREIAAAESRGLPVRRVPAVVVKPPAPVVATPDPLRQAFAGLVSEWGVFLVLALLVLIFLLCPGCGDSAWPGSVPAAR